MNLLLYMYLFTERCMQSWNTSSFFWLFIVKKQKNKRDFGFGSGSGSKFNCAARVGSDDLGYGPGTGFSLKPVQTSNRDSHAIHKIKKQNFIVIYIWSTNLYTPNTMSKAGDCVLLVLDWVNTCSCWEWCLFPPPGGSSQCGWPARSPVCHCRGCPLLWTPLPY